jgi:hypothetical protein
LTIKIEVGNFTVLKRISISWVAFQAATASFGSYGGQVSQKKYTGIISSDISNSLYQTPYLLYGFTNIFLENTDAVSLSTIIDDNFIFTISASRVIS